jgi:hypothetical protein
MCHMRPRGPCTTHTLPLGALHCVLPCRSTHGHLLTMVLPKIGWSLAYGASSQAFLLGVPPRRSSGPFFQAVPLLGVFLLGHPRRVQRIVLHVACVWSTNSVGAATGKLFGSAALTFV